MKQPKIRTQRNAPAVKPGQVFTTQTVIISGRRAGRPCRSARPAGRAYFGSGPAARACSGHPRSLLPTVFMDGRHEAATAIEDMNGKFVRIFISTARCCANRNVLCVGECREAETGDPTPLFLPNECFARPQPQNVGEGVSRFPANKPNNSSWWLDRGRGER